ncbi:MAG: hypothetical protein P4L63_03690 [Candidatus Pacebacteria bacterium]|nr:hypothetical protein [Candidatus Paceibacterota bacterium]
MKAEIYFKDLDFAKWSGKTIILDVDGTITTDGSVDVDPLVFQKVQELSMNNSVFIFSNKKLVDRNDRLSKQLKIPFIYTSFKKPNKKVIERLPEYLKRNLVVVGDKITIDGLFAKNIQAEFVKVKRLTSEADSLKTKLIYLLDNFINILIN